MTQLLPTFGAQIEDRAGFARAIGLEPGDLEELPIEAVSCGVAVPVRAGQDHGRRSTASRSTGGRWRASTSRRVRRAGGLLLHHRSHRRQRRRNRLQPHAGAHVRHQPRIRPPAARADRSAGTCSTTAWSRRAGAVDGQPPGRGDEAARAGSTSRSTATAARSRACGSAGSRCWWRRGRCSYEVAGSRFAGSRVRRRLARAWAPPRACGAPRRKGRRFEHCGECCARLGGTMGRKILALMPISPRPPTSPSRSSRRFARACTRRVRPSRKP